MKRKDKIAFKVKKISFFYFRYKQIFNYEISLLVNTILYYIKSAFLMKGAFLLLYQLHRCFRKQFNTEFNPINNFTTQDKTSRTIEFFFFRNLYFGFLPPLLSVMK